MTTAGQPASGRHPRLEMSGIAKHFGATVALDAVDLRVDSGQVLALVGENGAGKSTLMKILSGAVRPDAGGIQARWVSDSPRTVRWRRAPRASR